MLLHARLEKGKAHALTGVQVQLEDLNLAAPVFTQAMKELKDR
jgi:hypothetical protein